MRIVADHKIPFLKGALEGLAEVVYLPGVEINRADVMDADALIVRTRTRCDRALLEGSKVKFIATATIGFDHIDTEYCSKAGIAWTNAPGCNSASVRQYMASTLLYLALEQGLKLKGSTLGVIGAGNVGSKVAKMAEALGLRVLVNDPPRERREGPEGFVSLDQIQKEADLITFHVPLNREGEDKTFHMADETFIAACKPGVILVNTSRGPVVKEEALLDALKSKKVSHAILDVFEGEPEINPELHEALTLATPHIAGYSLDGKANGTTMSVQAVSRYFSLGLDHWEPKDITPPTKANLLGDAGAEDSPELLWELYRQSYDVSGDDARLREHPEIFEKLRGDYPLRREPEAYTVKLFQGYEEIEETLRKLGFEVLSDYCM